MIPRDAVIYSSRFWDEACSLLVARYAGMKVIKRLVEDEDASKNPVLGRYLGDVLDGKDDTHLLPFMIIVGNRDIIGRAFRTFIVSRAIAVVDAEKALPLLEDPELGVPPMCPSLLQSQMLGRDRICPEQFKALPEEDQRDYDETNIRCYHEDVEEAACPNRPDFWEQLDRRKAGLTEVQNRNYTILCSQFLNDHASLKWAADRESADPNAQKWCVYEKMKAYLQELGRPLKYKDIAALLRRDGIMSTPDGSKIITESDLRQWVSKTLKVAEEWRTLNDQIAGRTSKWFPAWDELDDIDKLFHILKQPPPR